MSNKSLTNNEQIEVVLRMLHTEEAVKNLWERQIGPVRMYVRPSDTGHGVCVYVIAKGIRKQAHIEAGKGAAKRCIEWIEAKLIAPPEGLGCSPIHLPWRMKQVRNATARRLGIRVHK